MKKISLTLVLLALLLTACNGTATQAAVAPVETQAETQTSSITAEGKLLPALSVELALAQGGVIAEVLVKPGDKVAAGDVLARLAGAQSLRASLAGAELEILTAQLALEQLTSPEAIANARLAVTRAQKDVINAQYGVNNQLYWKNAPLIQDQYANLVIAKEILDKAKTAYEEENVGEYINNADEAALYQVLYNAQEAYDRAENSYSIYSQKPTQRQLDEAQATLDLANAQLKNAQNYVAVLTGGEIPEGARGSSLQAYRQAKLAIQSAQDQAEAAKAALELYELRAPFGGTLLSADLKTGETAIPGQPVAFLADTTKWTVETKDLAEIDITRVSLGQSVTVILDGFPGEEFGAKVTTIDPVGQEYLGDMTYQVTVTLDEADPRFMWNMTATVSINTEGK